MTDYFYDMDLVVDPLNTANVVANGQVSIYDPADASGTVLLALKDPSGLPLPNPLTSNANGFLPPRIAQVPQTMWKSGGFTGYFNSYKGLRDEAIGAKTAAETAAANAGAAAQADLEARIASGVFKGDPGPNTVPTDAAIQQAITNSASATQGALNANYARLERGQVSPKALMRKGDAPQILSLITGTEDETLAVVNCTVSADTANYKLGSRAWKVTTAGAVANANVVLTPIPPSTSGPVKIRPAQAVCLWVYIEDVTKVTNVQIDISQDSGNTIFWTRSNTSAPVQPLVNGWNLLRWKMAEGLPAGFTGTTANRVRVYTTTTAATSITIGHLYLETPPKARMIFVADRGYKSFVVNGLPALRAAGVPVTWALDILKLGDHAGQFPNGPTAYAESINEADVAQFAAEGDSISFHGFTANPTAAMSEADIRKDTVQCLKWLQARGYRGRMWRAAWVQNQATNHLAADPYVIGQATWDVTKHSVALDCWPPRDMQNIARWEFYGKANLGVIDNQFGILKRTHGLMVVYNHGVGTGYSGDATQVEFDRFMQNVNTGISEGWLEATTFEALFAESGGTFQTLNGATVATYTDRDGNRVTKTAL